MTLFNGPLWICYANRPISSIFHSGDSINDQIE